MILTLMLVALGCADDGEPASPTAEKSAGGESPVKTAKHNIDEGHEKFKTAIEPAAEFVDEKTREAVGEGKKAFRKVTGQPVEPGGDAAPKHAEPDTDEDVDEDVDEEADEGTGEAEPPASE